MECATRRVSRLLLRLRFGQPGYEAVLGKAREDAAAFGWGEDVLEAVLEEVRARNPGAVQQRILGLHLSPCAKDGRGSAALMRLIAICTGLQP